MCGNLHSNTFFTMDGHTIKIFVMLSTNNEVLRKYCYLLFKPKRITTIFVIMLFI